MELSRKWQRFLKQYAHLPYVEDCCHRGWRFTEQLKGGIRYEFTWPCDIHNLSKHRTYTIHAKHSGDMARVHTCDEPECAAERRQQGRGESGRTAYDRIG